jgi:hypothetical protein
MHQFDFIITECIGCCKFFISKSVCNPDANPDAYPNANAHPNANAYPNAHAHVRRRRDGFRAAGLPLLCKRSCTLTGTRIYCH